MADGFPDNTLQGLADSWWTLTHGRDVCRGRLLRTFVPYADHSPQRLVIEGRSEATEHSRANYRMEALNISRPPPRPSIPVGAVPSRPGEELVVYRGKVRPVLVLGTECPEVPRSMRVGAARYQTMATVLVAPYYGVDRDGSRGGWNDTLVNVIRRCEFPQYMWDSLPLNDVKESILRFDSIQPVALHYTWYDTTPYCLSSEAMGYVDQWIEWLLSGVLSSETTLGYVRSELMKLTR